MKHAFDLTPLLSTHLKQNLIYPLLEFVQHSGLYPRLLNMRMKFAILRKSHMVDYLVYMHLMLNECVLSSGDTLPRRKEVLDNLERLHRTAKPILNILSAPELVQRLKQHKTQKAAHILQNDFKVDPVQIDALYHLAKYLLKCGDYQSALNHLHNYLSLKSHMSNYDELFEGIWGKLCAAIMIQRWDVASEAIIWLRSAINNRRLTTHLDLINQRSCLMHWALFVFFNREGGRAALIDLFFQSTYLSAIQSTCHHLLRYLTCAVVVNKCPRNIFKDLTKVVLTEEYNYKDPMTSFVLCLYVHYDFDQAEKLCKVCDDLITNDFFLCALKNEFKESARLSILDIYCRLHTCININSLADQLEMTPIALESWIATSVRHLQLDGKIGCRSGQVTLEMPKLSPYHRIVEKAHLLAMKTYRLSKALVLST
jgi:translation initiation factor 3 subunit E